MATGADIMCGRINTGSPTKPAPQDQKIIQIQAAESSGLSISSAISTPAVEVEGELLKVPVTPPQPGSSSWTSKQKWWRPDPATGTWVPEGHEGQVTTSADATKSASRSLRFRSETSASVEDKRWLTSMEELPDMDRAK